MSKITRRDFLKGAAAGSLGLAASALMPSLAFAEEPEAIDEDWLGKELETPAEFAEEVSADVVVLGQGWAGVAATRMAVEEGASVVVLEKGESIGMPSTAMAAIGSKIWAEKWPMDEKFYNLRAFLVNETSKLCLDRNKSEILKKWAEENGEAVDWWLSAVADDEVSWGTQENDNSYDSEAPLIAYNDVYPRSERYDPTREDFPCVPGSIQLKPAGAWHHANLAKAQEEAGDRLKIYTYTPGIKLLKDDTGRVVGVVGQCEDGSYIKVNASKGVVLATGGFMNNPAMVKALLPDVYNAGYQPESRFYTPTGADGKKTNTGDGHRMGIWAGGRMQAYAATMSHLVAVSKTIGTMPLLFLDARGERFMNEDAQGQQFAERVRQLPGMFAYQILDGAYDEELPEMPVGHGKNPGVTLAEVDAKVDGDRVVKADSLEELLSLLDLDAEAAAKAIAHYNELCDAGVDSDFGKCSRYLFPIRQAPFYAIKYGRGDDLVTVSGLECDTECRVLDSENKVIPGLYVAGNVMGGRFACIYPETMRGLSVASAMTFGRVAGRSAARGL